METRRKRTLAYELMLDVAAVPLAERADIMLGAEQFFAHGWPINHFTVGMAARAGMGLVPLIYEGLGSEGRCAPATGWACRDFLFSSLLSPVSSAAQWDEDPCCLCGTSLVTIIRTIFHK